MNFTDTDLKMIDFVDMDEIEETERKTMLIKDLESGRVFTYGNDNHDSLRISEDGRTLSYYNLQNGDGSQYGNYRFVMEDGEVPEKSQTADAIHCESYFNIGGWGDYERGKKDMQNFIEIRCRELGIDYTKIFTSEPK